MIRPLLKDWQRVMLQRYEKNIWQTERLERRFTSRRSLTHRRRASSSSPAWVKPAPLFNTFTATRRPSLPTQTPDQMCMLVTGQSKRLKLNICLIQFLIIIIIWCLIRSNFSTASTLIISHSLKMNLLEVLAEPYSGEITPAEFGHHLVSSVEGVPYLDGVVPTLGG